MILTKYAWLCLNENRYYLNILPAIMKTPPEPPFPFPRDDFPSLRASIRVYPSQRLFQGGNIVWIEHEGERYTLRRTRQGKLILTK